MFFLLMFIYHIFQYLLYPVYCIFVLKEAGMPGFKRLRVFRRLRAYRGANWVHAASVGEVLAAGVLIRELKEREPHVPVVLSTVTSSGQEQGRQTEAQEVFHMPLDLFWFLVPLFRALEPRRLILVETEIWPHLMLLARRFGAALYMVSGRMSPGTHPWYRRMAFFFRPLLNLCTAVVVQNEGERERFLHLGLPSDKVLSGGNLKMDLSQTRLDPDKTCSIMESWDLEESIILIAGSTHAGEEEDLIYVFRKLQISFPSLRLILAPRHMHRVPQVEKLLERENLSYSLRTQGPGDTPVLILDTLGELFSLYPLANLAFIGGSLVPLGGHNPLEALGQPIFFGPHMDSVADLAQLMVQHDLARQVQDREELYEEFLAALTGEATWLKGLTKRAKSFQIVHGGTARRTADLIFRDAQGQEDV